MTENLDLGFDFKFNELYSREGLARLDVRFANVLNDRNPELHNRFMAAFAAQSKRHAGKTDPSLDRPRASPAWVMAAGGIDRTIRTQAYLRSYGSQR